MACQLRPTREVSKSLSYDIAAASKRSREGSSHERCQEVDGVKAYHTMSQKLIPFLSAIRLPGLLFQVHCFNPHITVGWIFPRCRHDVIYIFVS